MNIMKAKIQHANQCILQQIIALGQIYQAKFEQIAGTTNMRSKWLSQLHMQDPITEALLQEVYAIDTQDEESNSDFPLEMTRIRLKQD